MNSGSETPARPFRVDRAASVGPELEAIFGPPKPILPRRRRAPRSPVVRLQAPPPSRRRRLGFLAVGLGALVVAGVAVGGLMADLEPARAPSAQPSAPIRVAAFESPLVSPAAQAVSPAVERSAPEPSAAAVSPVSKRETGPRPAQRPARTSSRCVRPEGFQRGLCLQPQIVRADQQLRRAYARAARAGVSKEALEDYRRRWSRVRRDAADDPARVARRFSAMAGELDRAAHIRGQRS